MEDSEDTNLGVVVYQTRYVFVVKMCIIGKHKFHVFYTLWRVTLHRLHSSYMLHTSQYKSYLHIDLVPSA